MSSSVKRRYFGCFILYLVNNVLICSTANITSDEDRLYEVLFKNYNPATRPVNNASDTVNVRITVSLIQIKDMDETNQVLRTHMWLHQHWKDESLNWNPDHYNGLEEIYVPSDTIWLPDVMLYNSADDSKSGKMQGNVIINSNGMVVWPQSLQLHSSCAMNIRNFPFDVQSCFLKFASWTHNGLKVNLSIYYGKIEDLSEYFFSNTEWNLDEFKAKINRLDYACCPDFYVDFTVTMIIRRRPLYYFYTIICPCLWLTVLNLLVFLLPAESGDKVSLGVTVFLAFSVFMLVISEKVPVSSQSVPLIGTYLTVTMGMTSLSLFMTVFILNLHHVTPHRQGVPRWLRFLSHDVLSRILCLKPRAKPFVRLYTNEAGADIETQIADDNRTKNDIATLLNMLAGRQYADEHQQKITDEWRFVALVFDRLLFWIFLIGNALISVIILCILRD
ncbi:neuronal acetylcholine receptor subunit alpha-10-like isoform X2 [Ruditapes philippinarum]|uniref:neuronal acetylcholine receptor subunit alpha-10-like isoform X2 n=1 Tax=Ruditapes philippinarum TaxID=129788 RepID=UPI00295AF558|nr:neuronal acetylcholine receptor subunit alpha-10-like isoform X2 [Ruditapes philippinarum]XP_060561674.1 neuronal acetylcholine receptor subunit alpha-10-like isoform X2 [Ruditapes philippinarum]